MGKNQSASGLTNVIQYSNGNITFVSGSTTLMSISSSGAITTTGVISGSNALSASYAANADTLDGLDSTVFTLTSSFNAFSSSILAQTASLNAFSASILATTASLNSFSSSVLTFTGSAATRLGALEAATASLYTATSSLNTFSASVLTFTGSAATRLGALEAATGSLYSYTSSLNNKTSSFATTGSNNFIGTQTITGSVLQSGSFTSTGTLTAQTLVVQTITSSVVYSSGSNIFGNAIANTQTFTGSVLVTGSLTISTGGNASAPIIFGSTIACSPIGCFATSCATSFIGGTLSGTTIYGSTAVCSPVGKFTSCIDAGSGTFSGNVVIGGSSPVYLKFNVQETAANRVAILYRGTQGGDASMITAFGTPYLSIGGQENLVNSIQTIGFGFTNGTTYTQPAEIGFQTTSTSGYTCGDLVFATRGATTNTIPTERMRITSAGNVGIGTTNTTGKVSIQQTINDSGLYFFNCSSGTRFMFNHYCGSGINSLIIQEFDSCNAFCRNIIALASGGNVGIGVASPAGKLDVYAGSYQNLIFKAESANQSSLRFNESTNGPRLYSDAGTEEFRMQQSYTGTGFLTFYTGPNERMRITSTGIACFACQICAPRFSGTFYGTHYGFSKISNTSCLLSSASSDVTIYFTSGFNIYYGVNDYTVAAYQDDNAAIFSSLRALIPYNYYQSTSTTTNLASYVDGPNSHSALAVAICKIVNSNTYCIAVRFAKSSGNVTGVRIALTTNGIQPGDS